MEKVLPKGWVETELGSIFNLVYGKGISTKELISGDFEEELYYNVYGANGIIGKYSNYTYEKTKVIISCRGAASGVIHKTKPYSFVSSNSIVLDDVSDSLLNLDFVKYILTAVDKSDIITGTAQPQITIQLLQYLKIPFPPLAEQERIVAKLDALFAQHEIMKKALDRIPQLLKNFRQQVLTQAVTGKLTEEWREGKDLEEWKIEKALDCCDKVQSGGTPKGSNFSLEGIPFLKVYNIVNNKIDFDSEPQFVSEEIHNTQIKKSIAYPGDVIMNIVGPPLNKVAIITDQYAEWNLNQAITIFRVGSSLDKKFLYYYFCEGSSVKSLGHDLRGVVGQANISLSQCRNFDIPIPPLAEQQEIVSRVESFFAKSDAIEAIYTNLKKKIDSLPQALLHKAFKGELVPQLPTDGDAKDLLAEIMALKKEVKRKKKN